MTVQIGINSTDGVVILLTGDGLTGIGAMSNTRVPMARQIGIVRKLTAPEIKIDDTEDIAIVIPETAADTEWSAEKIYTGTFKYLVKQKGKVIQSGSGSSGKDAHGNEITPTARIAADESIRKAEDPLKVARANAADLMVIKAAPLGGVRRALALVEQAQLPAVVSSALESSVGIATGASLAASLPTLKYGCGLGTVSLMAEDVTDEPLIARDGFMDLRTITPSPQRLERLASDEQTRQWWVERVTACYRALERTCGL